MIAESHAEANRGMLDAKQSLVIWCGPTISQAHRILLHRWLCEQARARSKTRPVMAQVLRRYQAILGHFQGVQPAPFCGSAFPSLRYLSNASGGRGDSNPPVRPDSNPPVGPSHATDQLPPLASTPPSHRTDQPPPPPPHQPYEITDERLEVCDVTADSLLIDHQVSLPPSSRKYLSVLARATGAKLISDEARCFDNEIRIRKYPEPQDHERLYPPGTLEDTQMELIRRHNSSMPCKKNQRIYGTVYAVSKERVWVDIGIASLAILSRKVGEPQIQALKLLHPALRAH
jgi:hypothetical protein